MRKIVLPDEVAFEKVDWGLTKNLVGPQSVGSQFYSSTGVRVAIRRGLLFRVLSEMSCTVW